MTGDDLSLLHEFAAHRTEAAFAVLVQRHLGLVYSAALRQTGGDAHLAQEIAQKVFILLAQKAGRLGEGTILSAWLYRAALYTAADTLKQNRRRQLREQEAFMQSQTNETDRAEVWRQLAPVLDETMGELGETDRAALVLRYFENKTAGEIAVAMNIGEDAAQKRVSRALEKLRSLLTKRGVTLGATAIAGAVTANAVTAAPTILANTITTAVLTGTGLTLANVAMTTLQKIAVTAVLTATVGFGVYQAKQAHEAQSEAAKLQAQQAPMQEQIQQLQTELAGASNTIAGLREDFAKNQKDNSELLKLRGEVGVLKRQTEEANQKVESAEHKLAELISVKDKFNKREQGMVNSAKQIGLAFYLFAGAHQGRLPTNYLQITNELGGMDRMIKMDVWAHDLMNIAPDGSVVGLSATNSRKPEHPNLIVLRERIARQSPDGTWNRVYGFVDGSVVTATSYDGNFSAWEKANGYTPPPPTANQ